MPTSQIKELYVGVIGWIWFAAAFGCWYFLVRAVVFGDGWWLGVASVAVAGFLYGVTLLASRSLFTPEAPAKG
jgi:hypothetical protein